MPAKGVFSLTATIVLCLPSVMGGLALLTNLLLQQASQDTGVKVPEHSSHQESLLAARWSQLQW